MHACMGGYQGEWVGGGVGRLPISKRTALGVDL